MTEHKNNHVTMNFYMDLMFMLIKELVESFLDDGHHNLCNNDFAWHLKNNGCGRWLFLEMNLVFIGVMAAVVGRS